MKLDEIRLADSLICEMKSQVHRMSFLVANANDPTDVCAFIERKTGLDIDSLLVDFSLPASDNNTHVLIIDECQRVYPEGPQDSHFPAYLRTRFWEKIKDYQQMQSKRKRLLILCFASSGNYQGFDRTTPVCFPNASQITMSVVKFKPEEADEMYTKFNQSLIDEKFTPISQDGCRLITHMTDGIPGLVWSMLEAVRDYQVMRLKEPRLSTVRHPSSAEIDQFILSPSCWRGPTLRTNRFLSTIFGALLDASSGHPHLRDLLNDPAHCALLTQLAKADEPLALPVNSAPYEKLIQLFLLTSLTVGDVIHVDVPCPLVRKHLQVVLQNSLVEVFHGMPVQGIGKPEDMKDLLEMTLKQMTVPFSNPDHHLARGVGDDSMGRLTEAYVSMEVVSGLRRALHSSYSIYPNIATLCPDETHVDTKDTHQLRSQLRAPSKALSRAKRLDLLVTQTFSNAGIHQFRHVFGLELMVDHGTVDDHVERVHTTYDQLLSTCTGGRALLYFRPMGYHRKTVDQFQVAASSACSKSPVLYCIFYENDLSRFVVVSQSCSFEVRK